MSQPVRYAIFIYENVEPIDIGATFGVLSMARRIAPEIELFVVAENAGPVTLANGLVVHADYGLDACPNVDILIVTGGAGWTAQTSNLPVLEFIRNAASRTTVASVCTGALILAAAGVLKGLPATTKQEVYGKEPSPLLLLSETDDTITGVSARFVDTGRIITGGGVSLATDLTLHLIEKTSGAEVARETARIIEYSAALQANEMRLTAMVV